MGNGENEGNGEKPSDSRAEDLKTTLDLKQPLEFILANARTPGHEKEYLDYKFIRDDFLEYVARQTEGEISPADVFIDPDIRRCEAKLLLPEKFHILAQVTGVKNIYRNGTLHYFVDVGLGTPNEMCWKVRLDTSDTSALFSFLSRYGEQYHINKIE
ncbi:MAG: hypothetical protein V1740_03615 [Candidatus Woesearchaeota archaeon]